MGIVLTACLRRRQEQDKAIVVHKVPSQKEVMKIVSTDTKNLPSAQLARRLASKWPRPKWHPPWRCYRVISGHLGCVELPAAEHLFYAAQDF